MEVKILQHEIDAVTELNRVGAVDENGQTLSSGAFRYRNTALDGEYIKTMTVGGVATPVHLRRGGNVRRIFSYMHDKALEDGVGISILHPFSFAYYNMFDYEKVADHLIVRLPIRYVSFVPRRCSLVPYSAEMLGDMVELYDGFAKSRNISFERKTEEQFIRYKNAQTYVYYSGGKMEGYITYTAEKRLEINHFEDGLMTVNEMVYSSPEALRELLSFIRMYEGELEDVRFANLAMTPEVDMLFRNYTHTSYRILPDLSARIINTEMVLKHIYHPIKDGALTLKVNSEDQNLKGTYLIEWGDGDSRVRRSDAAECDIEVSARALARLVYGYDALTDITLPYIDGIQVNKNGRSFIELFPKKPGGLYEHF